MEGEWGPTDNGSSVADDPFHLHIAHLGSGSCRYADEGSEQVKEEATVAQFMLGTYRNALVKESNEMCLAALCKTAMNIYHSLLFYQTGKLRHTFSMF